MMSWSGLVLMLAFVYVKLVLCGGSQCLAVRFVLKACNAVCFVAVSPLQSIHLGQLYGQFDPVR
jgi:hypothetical protein